MIKEAPIYLSTYCRASYVPTVVVDGLNLYVAISCLQIENELDIRPYPVIPRGK